MKCRTSSRAMGRAGSLLAGLLLTSGCVRHTQRQYFAARDPETGITHYYRLTITGQSFLTKYNMQAGYFSAAAVDVIRGQMPKIPILDLPVDRLEVFERLSDHLYAGLIQTANIRWPIRDPEARTYVGIGSSERTRERIDQLTAVLTRMQKDLVIAQADEAVRQAAADHFQKECGKAAKKLKTETESLRKIDDTDKFEEQKKEVKKAQDNLSRKSDALTQALDELHPAQRVTRAVQNNVEALKGERDRLRAIRIPMAGASAGQPPSLAFSEEDRKALARLVWFGGLSRSDIASVGMTRETNPFVFRKLVFWATARNLDLSAFANEVDSVIDNVVAIAEAAQKQADARKLAKRNRRKARLDLLRTLPGISPEQSMVLNSIIDLVTGERAASGDAEGGSE